MSKLSDIKDEYFKTEYNNALKVLTVVRQAYQTRPKPQVLGDYKTYLQFLNMLIQKVNPVTLTYDLSVIKKRMEDSFTSELQKKIDDEYNINNSFETQLSERSSTLEKEAKEHNIKVKEQHDADNRIYLELEEKRKKLEEYSDEIVDLCSTYGITTSDVEIDNSSFTVEELSNVYDQYLNYMNKSSNRRNIIGIIREKVPDVQVQGLILIITFVAAFTVALDVLAILMFALVIRSQLKEKSRMKSYAVLLGLLYNIRPLEMGFKGDIDQSLLVDENIDEDDEELFGDIMTAWEEALDNLDSNNVEENLNMARVEFTAKMKPFQMEADHFVAEFNKSKEALLNELTSLRDSLQQEFEDKKSKIMLLGDEVKKGLVLDTNFALGLKDGVIEEFRDIGLKNIVIRPCKDDKLLRQFLQVLLANMLCNVRAGNMTAIVFDPNKFGQDVVSFYHADLELNLEFLNDDFSNVIERLKSIAMRNLKDMKGMSINEFNAEAERVGRTPKDYTFFMVLSQPKNIESNEELMEFMRYSAGLGIIVCLVTDKSIPDVTTFEVPFEGVEHPYMINEKEFGPKVANTLVRSIKESQSDSLAWKTFIDVDCPDKDTWSKVTDQFLDLDPGFWEGDPTQYKGYTIGNEGNVHVIAVGGTGAGKSVFLNHLVATITKMYSPRDLELWMVDYKGSEFSFYLSTHEHPKMLPHIKACLCTSDGDYSGSLYAALRSEAERRYAMLMKAGFKNIKDFNKAVRAGNMYKEIVDGEVVFHNKSRETFDEDGMIHLTVEDIVPRILFINDEFQVIFEKAEENIKDQIKKDITYVSKVARAAGVHLFFTSQSMKGTISDDILQQFTLRFALRCSEEVSTAILGTKYASSIKQKFGYLYVRSLEDKSLEAQKRFRTPFISDDVLREHINKMADLAEEGHYKKRDVITYLEDTKHNVEEIDAIYQNNDTPDQGLFILGERMTYSENKAPDNVTLLAENNSHIFATFSDRADLVNFYQTIRRNIDNHKVKPMMIINSQIKDLHYLCELDMNVPKEVEMFSSEKVSIVDLKKMFMKVYNTRVQTGYKEQAVYFILIGWDKAVGFGIDKDFDLVSDFNTMLQLAGEYNIHFIFLCTSGGQIGSNIVEACKFRISGKVDEATSYKIIDSKQASKPDEKLDNGYMYIYRGGVTKRAKIYRYKQTREIQDTEFKL